jgi:hypothetical protein
LQLLDDLEEMRGYWKLKEEPLDRFLRRTGFGKGFEPLARQTSECSTCVLKVTRFHSHRSDQPNNIGRRVQNYEPLLWVRAMAQAVGRRPSKTVVPVRSKSIPCGICSGKRRLEHVFLRVLKLPPVGVMTTSLLLDAVCSLFIVLFLTPPVVYSLLFKYRTVGLNILRSVVKGTENAVVPFLIKIMI